MNDAGAEYPFSDLALSRRLEMVEGWGGAAFAEVHARLDPAVGAAADHEVSPLAGEELFDFLLEISRINAEREGFRIAYTRVKWHLPAD